MLSKTSTQDSNLIRFQKEAKASAKLNHDYIVKIRDFGILDDGNPYMVLDYLEGKSLKECAEIMGMHYSRIRKVWREVVAKASEDEGLDSDMKEQLRVHLELQLRHIIQEGVANFDKGAAYGSAALAAMKQLADLYGLKRDIGSEPAEKVTMAELGQDVRAISPLLFKRLQEADLISNRSKGGTR